MESRGGHSLPRSGCAETQQHRAQRDSGWFCLMGLWAVVLHLRVVQCSLKEMCVADGRVCLCVVLSVVSFAFKHNLKLKLAKTWL